MVRRMLIGAVAGRGTSCRRPRDLRTRWPSFALSSSPPSAIRLRGPWILGTRLDSNTVTHRIARTEGNFENDGAPKRGALVYHCAYTEVGRARQRLRRVARELRVSMAEGRGEVNGGETSATTTARIRREARVTPVAARLRGERQRAAAHSLRRRRSN